MVMKMDSGCDQIGRIQAVIKIEVERCCPNLAQYFGNWYFIEAVM